MKKIKILQDVAVPMVPRFREGEERTVSDELAQTLIERGHAESVDKPKKKKEEKPKKEEEPVDNQEKNN